MFYKQRKKKPVKLFLIKHALLSTAVTNLYNSGVLFHIDSSFVGITKFVSLYFIDFKPVLFMCFEFIKSLYSILCIIHIYYF